ncbi:T9SS type B sorting domain-containing protein [Tenacibaculum sp. 190524A05c]|uniref:T9SS type B sorting domain-containing protein n=1 Tax=Tenacibaculum platacis TaxID=3137852 RepID=UPI0031FA79F1
MKTEKGILRRISLTKIYFILFSFLFCKNTFAQTPLFSGTPVSDNGSSNNIGSANTSRNVAVDNNGNIFIVYATPSEIRLSKSTNGGQSFLPSILVGTANNAEPEVAINDEGTVFIAWIDNSQVHLFSSTDGGNSFNTSQVFGNTFSTSVHISTSQNNVYLIDQTGSTLYYNNNNGVGTFNTTSTGITMVYADVLTDQNGAVYLPMDNPNLVLFESVNQGASLTDINLNPAGQVYFSSYALSDGPCGTFIFVGGGSISPSETLGYKIDVETGNATEITLGNNFITAEGRTLYADNKGTLIDGYRDDNENLMLNVSTDQGATFNTPILVANGGSHNIARSPTTDNIVVVYEQNGQIFSTVYDDLLKNIELIEPTPQLALCGSDSFDISFTLSGIFSPNTTWTAVLSDENGNFTNSISLGTVTTNNDGTINCTLPNTLIDSSEYRLLIESVDNCIQSNPISLTLGAPTIIGPTTACMNENIQLSSSSTSDETIPWTSSNPSVLSIDENGNITTIAPGTAEITYTTGNGCSSNITFEVFESPETNDIVILRNCNANDNGIATFNLTEANQNIIDNSSSFTISYFESFKEARENLDEIQNFDSYENEIPNTDTVWARIENNNGCVSYTQIDLIISSSILYTTQINDNSDNNSIQIILENSDTYNFEFSLLDSGNNVLVAFQDDPLFENLNFGIYTILIRDKLGCNEETQEVSLLNIPSFFTPNNDGVNDTWSIKGLSPTFYSSGNIYIYDRFGTTIAILPPDKPFWDGIYNGDIAPSNDYWFLISLVDVFGKKREVKGHFSLLRK